MTMETRARNMRTKEEIKNRCPIFLTKQWDLLKEGIRTQVKNKLAKTRARKIERLAVLVNQDKSIKRFIKNFSKEEIKLVYKKAKLIK